MSNGIFVLDTNTLISALLIRKSVNRMALEIAYNVGGVVFSKETLAELKNTLTRSKFDKYVSTADRISFIERFEIRGNLIETTSRFNLCRDFKDNMFLNLAYDAKASHIITGDKDLLVLNLFREIKIV